MAAWIISIGGVWKFVSNGQIVPNTTTPPPPPPALKVLSLSGATTAAQVSNNLAALALPGTHAIYALERPTDWTASRCFVSKWRDAGNQRSYWWGTGANGALYLDRSADGATFVARASDPPSPALVDNEWVWTRRTFTASTGQIQLSTSPASATALDPTVDPRTLTWTVRATLNPGVAQPALFASTAPFTIGADADRLYDYYAGLIAQIVITDAADAVAFKLDPNNWTTGTSWVTSTNHTVTLLGTGATVATVTPSEPDPDPDPDPPPPPPADGGVYPFTMPARSVVSPSGGGGRRVFSHYFTQFPVSLDNYDEPADYYTTQYTRPGGDGPGGNSFTYGGWFRNRPIGVDSPRAGATGASGLGASATTGRSSQVSGSWGFENVKDEIRWAIAAGYDGFTMDVLSLTGYHWDRIVQVYAAAAAVDTSFKILLMPDAAAGGTSDMTLLADRAEYLANTFPNTCFKRPDGRLVISPFLAEGKSASWWSSWLGIMAGRGFNIFFVPCFLNYWGNIGAFASISQGASIWGGRSVNSSAGERQMAIDAHNRGKIWMQPVATQDLRAHYPIYDEAWNTETFRQQWRIANETNSEWTQIITWNDYSEQAEICPSKHLGFAGIDLSAYYAVQFKLGTPAIVRDVAYVIHRIHVTSARPTGGQTSLMPLRAGSSPARDMVEVLTFCRSVTTVTVTVAGQATTYTAPAGFNARLVNWGNGAITVRMVAADGRVTTVTSPYATTNAPVVQDLQYRYVSSARSGTSTPAP